MFENFSTPTSTIFIFYILSIYFTISCRIKIVYITPTDMQVRRSELGLSKPILNTGGDRYIQFHILVNKCIFSLQLWFK